MCAIDFSFRDEMWISIFYLAYLLFVISSLIIFIYDTLIAYIKMILVKNDFCSFNRATVQFDDSPPATAPSDSSTFLSY